MHRTLLHPVEPGRFRLAALLISVLSSGLAGLAIIRPEGPWLVILAGFGCVMIANALFPHAALSLACRSYMPGTATGLLLVVPSGAVRSAGSCTTVGRR